MLKVKVHRRTLLLPVELENTYDELQELSIFCGTDRVGPARNHIQSAVAGHAQRRRLHQFRDRYYEHGTAVTLGTVNAGASIQNSYIQFDLGSIPSGFNGSNVARATLKLYVNSVMTAGSFNLDYVTSTWSEKTVTASLAPSLGTTVAGSVPLTSALVHD